MQRLHLSKNSRQLRLHPPQSSQNDEHDRDKSGGLALSHGHGFSLSHTRRPCTLGARHLQIALLYVDRNPLRAGLVGEATAYPWSSAHEHASGTDETKMLSWARLSEAGGCADWEQRLRARA